MIEHILVVATFIAWIAIEVRHRVNQRRRSQSLATPIARAQQMRRGAL